MRLLAVLLLLPPVLWPREHVADGAAAPAAVGVVELDVGEERCANRLNFGGKRVM